MKILAPPSAELSLVRARVQDVMNADRLFVDDMLLPLWAAAEHYGVDPVGMVAQAGKETGFGRFGGQVKPTFCNPCGLKTSRPGQFPGVDDGDRPLAHERFASWRVGAAAMAQHLRAYAGAPVRDLIVDPRYGLVFGKHRCEHFADLGGKWAPSPTYGTEVEAIAARLL